MTTATFTSDQVKEVSSWIHDEEKCVSIGAVSTGLRLSRSQAQALLQQIADTSSDKHSYQVTKCVVSHEQEQQGEETIASTGKVSSSCLRCFALLYTCLLTYSCPRLRRHLTSKHLFTSQSLQTRHRTVQEEREAVRKEQ